MFQHTAARRRLLFGHSEYSSFLGFNTQPHEGGCQSGSVKFSEILVSTHSRTKAAANGQWVKVESQEVSTHSRTKAAALEFINKVRQSGVSTHSRTKAAAKIFSLAIANAFVSTHSRTKAAALFRNFSRLELYVSTHSRTKAAAGFRGCSHIFSICFNTQPHEGGCSLPKKARKISVLNTVFR